MNAYGLNGITGYYTGKASHQLKGRKNTKKGKSEILTSSPYKNALKSAIKEKDEKIKNKAIAAQKQIQKQKRKQTTSRQKGIISKKQKVATTISDDSNKAKNEQAGEDKDKK